MRDTGGRFGNNSHTMPDPAQHPRWLLRRIDQIGVALFVVAALAAMAGWWIAEGGLHGRVVEIDKVEPLAARFMVDINTADVPELLQLPGVGQILAEQIVESRRTGGPFASQNDLMRVNGIGRKKFKQIRPYLQPIPKNAATGQ